MIDQLTIRRIRDKHNDLLRYIDEDVGNIFVEAPRNKIAREELLVLVGSFLGELLDAAEHATSAESWKTAAELRGAHASHGDERVRELTASLRQAALDIMNLGAFLRMDGKTELADIALRMEKVARDALSEQPKNAKVSST